MDMREMRAAVIAANLKLEPSNGRWKVPSQSHPGTYTVLATSDGSWACSCPDHEERLAPCKHIMAVEITIKRESKCGDVTFTEMVKVTYSQDWASYNAAQTNEHAMFRTLLADLCSLVPNPPQGSGRPRLPMSDMAFAVVAKTYARTSARRLSGRMVEDQEKGLTEKAPSFNSLLRYMRDPAMTQVLTDLIEISARPLAAIETQFAVDSTGFGTSNTRTWFSQKHGREMTEREWRKLHACCGTATHVITAAEVTPSNSNDAPHLPALVAKTAENFPGMIEVSADKGYLTKTNCEAVEKHGARPVMPFKSNSVEPPEGTAWARMYHLFAYRRDEFLARYHRRSNVETVFGMVKAKFGDDLFAKSPQAQTTEVLAKVVAHNLCVLIQAFYELGIDPAFDAAPAVAQRMRLTS